jgi:hypothetical protein
LTPLFLAFPDFYNDPMLIVDQTFNAMFAVDILFSFITAYYDEEYHIVDDRKVSCLEVS